MTRRDDIEGERSEDLAMDELEDEVADGKDSSQHREEARGKSQLVRDVEDVAEEIDISTISLSGDHMYSLEAASDAEFPGLGENPEVVMDEIDRYTDDDDILQDFAERQQLNAGRENLEEHLRLHHSKSPDLSGGDLDAAWQDADVSGEETIGSTVVTPDMDRVDELGDALGINYEDDEILATADKLDARDRNRWELSPTSMETDPDADEDENLDELLEDELDEDLDEELEEDELDDELEADLDDEFADEVKAELDVLDADEEDEIDEDDEGYDLEDDLEGLDDEDLEDFLDDDFEEDLDDDEDY